MEAKLKSSDDVMVIQIKGTLDIEHTQGFKNVVLQKFRGQKMVFNMANATFVGSTGIGAFLDTVKELANHNSHGLKIVAVSPDFKRIFQNLEIAGLAIFDSENGAISSFQEPVPWLPTGIAPVGHG